MHASKDKDITVNNESNNNEIQKEEQVAGMQMIQREVKRLKKSTFRPCQTEYFDDFHVIVGEVSDKIDIRMLKNKF